MDLATLLILAVVMAGLAAGAFFGLIFLAILTYVAKNLYPVLRRIGLWAARLQNFLPLLILDVILIILIILILVVAFRLPAIATLFLILIDLLLLGVLMLVGTLVGLAIVVYIIRLARWLYRRWKGLLGGLWPQIMRLKVKHDVGKDKDKDWTTHFAEMRKKLGEEAEEARRRISGGGK
jgi:signal transduction histidine kinase